MPKPVINKDKCVNCGTCVEVCPMGVFEMQDGEVKVVKPEECIGCRACEAQCPQSAIEIED